MSHPLNAGGLHAAFADQRIEVGDGVRSTLFCEACRFAVGCDSRVGRGIPSTGRWAPVHLKKIVWTRLHCPHAPSEYDPKERQRCAHQMRNQQPVCSTAQCQPGGSTGTVLSSSIEQVPCEHRVSARNFGACDLSLPHHQRLWTVRSVWPGACCALSNGEESKILWVQLLGHQ